jgi:hypothetical protein
MNNGNANALTLATNISISGTATFTLGDIVTGANMVLFNAGSSATGMTNASYVSGTVRKTGNTAFTFPTGKGGYYAPIRISAPGNATYFFTAEYFNADPNAVGYTATALGTGLNHVSRCEYWSLLRSAGASNETVTLYWDTPRSCGVTDPGEIRVAGWSGTQWTSWGNGTNNGNVTAGNETSSMNVSTFTAFTLASSTANNPLPIRLISFTAEDENDHVLLTWKTASEINNEFFTVEKSRDGKVWYTVGTVAGSGSTHLLQTYSLNDTQPWSGIQYYRLSQTDYDHVTIQFPVISLDIERLSEKTTVTLHPNPTDDQLNIDMNTASKLPFRMQLIDSYGRVAVEMDLHDSRTTISLKTLSSGIYVVFIKAETEVFRSKIIRR